MNNKKVLGIVAILLSLVLVMLTGMFVYVKLFDGDKVDNRVLDLSKLQEYMNYDGTYGSMESILYTDVENDKVYRLSVSFDGKLYTGNYGNKRYIENVDNVIDIVSYNDGVGGIEVQKCYVLTENGDVYLYSISDLIIGKFEAIKVENVSNIDRLVSFSFGPEENSSSVWGILAITEEGEYIRIATASV